MKYATGKNALGICDRCGKERPLLALVPDGDKPGLMVCPECRDIKHPQEKPVRLDEGIVLKNPRPNREIDTTDFDSEETLVEALGWADDPDAPYFGGET